ncbi:hypothetical protein FISHEDRAFT_65936 [Fistulina hepatica ATCC 64428]|uniref:Phytase-like domain-containing protein n=1 Tax=Fistulina hepatica ATCC 64428 TaxID=1128425 RepID=A0A0D7ADE9_9AGAR|nr:hypothetical protein FISHEDRAFT_65936 [Fistulina hepatica ATCC 64428]
MYSATLLLLCGILESTRATPVHRFQARSDTDVELNGVTYVNKGIVAYGYIPADFRDSTGDTLGGFGSAAAFKLGTWTNITNGSYSGTLVVHPDCGYNVEGTVDYQSRRHNIDFLLTPYYGTTTLDDATETLQLFYRNKTKTTGLDALSVRAPVVPRTYDDPAMPIANKSYPHLSVDIEGIVLNNDSTHVRMNIDCCSLCLTLRIRYWISDEYGPYIYLFSEAVALIRVVQPPAAILPMDANGKLNFTSGTEPATRRTDNQGFEGLTVDSETGILYAMLQTATIQDGGGEETTSRYTRLFAFDVSGYDPVLTGECVVPLPVSSKNKTRGCSEIHALGVDVFLALSRDSKGKGGDDTESKYKQADLFSVTNATDIHDTDFDDPAYPVAVGGLLNGAITPAEYVGFVNFIDEDQLTIFGLHNGGDDDDTLIDSKWESLALAPVGEEEYPDDYFLFSLADNDFMTTDGMSVGVTYNASENVNNQALVFRITLPGVPIVVTSGAPRCFNMPSL